MRGKHERWEEPSLICHLTSTGNHMHMHLSVSSCTHTVGGGENNQKKTKSDPPPPPLEEFAC